MRKSKLIIWAFMVLVTTIVTSTSISLAWYASSTNLNINSIEVVISHERDLKISLSPDSGYKTSLKEGEDELQKVQLYKPVSSMFSKLWLNDKKSMPEFRDAAIRNEGHQETVLASGGYYSQELYLLADDDLYITLDPENTLITPNDTLNSKYASDPDIIKKYPDMSFEERKQILDNIIYSLRISILIPEEEKYSYTIIDPFKKGDTYFGGLLDSLVDKYYDSMNVGLDRYEILYGEHNNIIVYDEPSEEDILCEGTLNAFNAHHESGVYLFNEEKSKENGLMIAKEQSLTFDDLKGQNPEFMFLVRRNRPQKIVLSMYLEGWDLDSVNTTMGANFISDIAFKIVKEAVI